MQNTEQSKEWKYIFRLKGTILQKIWLRLLLLLCFSLLVSILFDQGYFFSNKVTFSVTLLGFPLGIFLGFRNNQSFQRLKDSQLNWTLVSSGCITFSRQVQLLAGIHWELENKDEASKKEKEALQTTLIQKIAEFPLILHRYLIAQTNTAKNPQLCIHEIGAVLREATTKDIFDGVSCRYLDQTLSNLTKLLSDCERIQKIPFPTSLTILTKRAVFLYCFSLPLGLIAQSNWLTPMITVLVGYFFFSLEALSEEFSNPFVSAPYALPMERIANETKAQIHQDDFLTIAQIER